MPKAVILDDPEVSHFAGLRYVSLRLLWDCNLRCVMCDHPHKAKSEMSVETARKVLDQLSHPVRLTFIGGEPCLWLIRHQFIWQRSVRCSQRMNPLQQGCVCIDGSCGDEVCA